MDATPNNLIQIVTTALASTTQRSGHHLVCRPGCYQCCIGVFPISHEDAHRLREGLLALEKSNPEKATRIHTRVNASIGPRVWPRIHAGIPARVTGILHAGIDALAAALAVRPEQETGRGPRASKRHTPTEYSRHGYPPPVAN